MGNINFSKGSMIFALDIGTRSVVGLLGSIEDDKIIVHHSAMKFHKERVMYDGQIHDINGVAKIVELVKEDLESQTGYKLEEVAIAAAGRSLKVYETTIEKKLDKNREIDRHLLNSLEIEGLQKAQNLIREEDEENKDYLCVGHTVVNYYLDDALITNPTSHRSETIKADILATFLPQIVVDGLHSVMAKVGLEISFMTLEPIAAIEVAVPQNVRLLNVALVDIGAGTSDIAITKDGTITGYAMTSIAGDEVTEAIAKNYLMDFDSAEELKCNLNKSDVQQLTDILGIAREIRTEDILKNIYESIELTGREIADSILEQNDKAPSAVFLIGGGSQVPGLSEAIGKYLDLPSERVALRSVDTIQNLTHDNTILIGPESITPVGILVKAINSNMADFINVKVNGKQIKLFHSKRLKVSDALVIAGFSPRDLIPKKGKSISIYINGQIQNLYGEYGEAAKIYINNKVGNLETIIKNGDIIDVSPADSGKKPLYSIKDIINKEKGFSLNGQFIDSVTEIKINGTEPEEGYSLADGDKVEYKELRNVEELCEIKGIDIDVYDVYINGELANKDTSIKNNDKVIVLNKSEKIEINDNNNYKDHILVNYNGETLKIPRIKEQLLFVDLFHFVDFDRSRALGKLILKLNGRYANYTDRLEDGDFIEVYWE